MSADVEILRFTGVERRFGQTLALDGIDLAFGPGRLVGVVGRNGAGKTTLLRLATGLLAPSRGAVALLGVDLARNPSAVVGRVGYLDAGDRGLPPRLTARAGLELFAVLQGCERAEGAARIEELRARLTGGADWDQPFQTMSTGQRQRVAFARALLAQPAVLLLDEPTKGLDAEGATLVFEVAREEARRGALVIVASHDLVELEGACDEVVVLDGGRLVARGPTESILPAVAAPGWTLTFRSEQDRARALSAGPWVEPAGDARDMHVPFDAPLAVHWNEWCPAVSSIVRRERASLAEFLAGSDMPANANSTPPTPHAASPPMRRAEGRLAVIAAIVRRDGMTEMSYRFKLVMQALVMAAWAIGLIFVGRVFRSDGELGQALHGQPFGFLLIGLAALEASHVAVGRMGMQLREEQLLGTLEPLLASGRSPLLLVLSSLLWPLGAVLLIASVICAFGLGHSGADPAWGPALVAVALGVSSLASIGLVSAAFVHVFKRGDPVSLFLNLVGLLTAGAYFPREVLPDAVRSATAFSPYTTWLAALRAALLDGDGFDSPTVHRSLGTLAGFALVAIPTSIAIWTAAHRIARRSGTLSQM